MIKEFIESFEEFLLVSSMKFSEKSGVVGLGCAFKFNQASTDFALTVIGRFVTLLFILSTK